MTQVNRKDGVPEGNLSRARVELTLGNTGAIMHGEESLTESLRHGLYVSVKGLAWTLQLIVIGLCLIVPWALLLWVGWRVLRRSKSKPATDPTAPPPAGPRLPRPRAWRRRGREPERVTFQPEIVSTGPRRSFVPTRACDSRGREPARAPARGSDLGVQELKTSGPPFSMSF